MDDKKTSIADGIILTLVILGVIALAYTVAGRTLINKWDASLKEADVNSKYETQKEIEDTLRSYIASYEADRITWETNKNIDNAEAQQLAVAALTRANRTAATYNQYYLKNSFVWKDNIPSDIQKELPYLSDVQE